MPYIPTAERKTAKPYGTAGEFNYLLTKLCLERADLRGHRYSVYNDIIGALECAKLEMYRRMVAPYEDIKIIENGDVYYGTGQQAAETFEAKLSRQGAEL